MSRTKKRASLPRVLVLAGLDPSGRAGLLADGEAILASGAQPILCATAIAAQSKNRLVHTEGVSPRALRAQVDAALEDGEIGAVKVGMLGSRALLEVVHELLTGPLARLPVVLDPVWKTSRGGSLFDGSVDDYMPLLERADLVTPNLSEATLLSGLELSDEALMYEAASRIALRGARAVLLKGGHLAGTPVDLLLEGGQPRWFRGERIKTAKRGTGCRLASAIAASLAAQHTLGESVERAIDQVRRYLRE